MSSGGAVEPEERLRGDRLALRFGGSMTGVGIATGVAYLIGSDTAFAAPMSAAMLLVGITLLAVGHRSWRKNAR